MAARRLLAPARRWLALPVLLAAAAPGCGDNGVTPSYDYLGAFHVGERVFQSNGAASGYVFGRVGFRSAIQPTAWAGACSYYATRLPAGIDLGDLSLTGLTSDVVVSPTSFTDGFLYLSTLSGDAIPDRATVRASLAGPDDGPVTVEAVAPPPLTWALLPTVLSRSAPAAVVWARATNPPGTTIEITLEVSGLGREERLACAADDDGGFGFPAAALAMLGEGDAVLTLTRRTTGQAVSEPLDAILTLAVESTVWDNLTLEP